MAAGSFGATHVFWYKALDRGYNLQDNPGPNIPAGAIVHERMIMSAGVPHHSGDGDAVDGFSCGSGPYDAEGRCGIIWSRDLCEMQGFCTSAKFSGEFRDGWAGKAFCNAGPIAIRCGVVDFQGNLDIWGSPDQVAETATWQDYLNTLGGSMGYDRMNPFMEAEDTINYTAPAGRSDSTASVLDGLFVEIDITDQVNWILGHTGANKGSYSGQYAIAFLVTIGLGSTGKINLYADEAASGYQMTLGSDAPWTTDGNTAHLVVQGDLTLIPGISVEHSINKNATSVSLSAWPNPFHSNINIQISGAERQARLELFGIDGKRIAHWRLAGEGPRHIEYSPDQSLATGLYVLRLSSGSRTLEKRLLFIK